MTLWCLECALNNERSLASRTVEGDPLCEFHARAVETQQAGTAPGTPPAKKKPGRPKGTGRKNSQNRILDPREASTGDGG